MADDVSRSSEGPGWLPFDLLGHRVPANKGRKGRPQHAPTAENLEKLVLLYAAGHSDAECAAAVGVSIDTMKRHYFASRELQTARRNARMVVEGELLGRLNAQSKAGNTAATDKLIKRLDRSRLGPMPGAARPKKARLGKKAERVELARFAGAGDEEWDGLIGPASAAH